MFVLPWNINAVGTGFRKHSSLREKHMTLKITPINITFSQKNSLSNRHLHISTGKRLAKYPTVLDKSKYLLEIVLAPGLLSHMQVSQLVTHPAWLICSAVWLRSVNGSGREDGHTREMDL